jgi:transposase
LTCYVVEVVEGLDLRELERAYAGRGSPPYRPALLLSLLIYGCATGCFSSRKIERATYDSLAFRCIAANAHPDHDTLATFRKRFAKEFEAVFVRVLQAAHKAKLAVRAAKAAARGRKPRGKAPQPPTPGPRPTDQINPHG